MTTEKTARQKRMEYKINVVILFGFLAMTIYVLAFLSVKLWFGDPLFHLPVQVQQYSPMQSCVAQHPSLTWICQR